MVKELYLNKAIVLKKKSTAEREREREQLSPARHRVVRRKTRLSTGARGLGGVAEPPVSPAPSEPMFHLFVRWQVWMSEYLRQPWILTSLLRARAS